VIDREHQVTRAREMEQCPRVRGPDGERLLDENVLARAQRPLHHGGVLRGGHRDQEGIGRVVSERLVHVGVAGNGHRRAEVLSTGAIVNHTDDVQRVNSPGDVEQPRSPVPVPD
jgi:hypothetical protein